MTSIQYLRYVAYALFAVGIINLRYQSGAHRWHGNSSLRTDLFQLWEKSSRNSGWKDFGVDSVNRCNSFRYIELAHLPFRL
jgi:hypothetical protein